MESKREVLFVIAPENFRDEELFGPKEILEAAGFKAEIVSKNRGTIKGILGKTVEVKKTIAEIAVADYQAIIFVGGPGTTVYFDDLLALDLAKEAAEQEKVIGAICIAPSILANAGLLSGRQATAFSSEKKALENGGALWEDQEVVVDGKIVTASGPKAAKEFGWKIVSLLTK